MQGRMERLTNGRTNGNVDGQTGGWMLGHSDGWTDGRTDPQIESLLCDRKKHVSNMFQTGYCEGPEAVSPIHGEQSEPAVSTWTLWHLAIM